MLVFAVGLDHNGVTVDRHGAAETPDAASEDNRRRPSAWQSLRHDDAADGRRLDRAAGAGGADDHGVSVDGNARPNSSPAAASAATSFCSKLASRDRAPVWNEQRPRIGVLGR